MQRQNSNFISIIINCHNGEKFLKECIDSVFSQTYKNWEIIFIDNFSTDNSALIAKSYKSKLKYLKTKKYLTLYEARNYALGNCNGTLITFLDCDDIWSVKKLEMQLEVYQNGYLFSFGDYDFIDQNSNKLRIPKPYKHGIITTNSLIKKNIISIGTVMIEKSLFKKDLFDPKYELLGDFDLWIRLSLKTKIFKCKGLLESSRVHDKNHSMILKDKWLSERRYFYRKFLKSVNILKFPEIFQYIIFTEIKGLLKRK